MRTLLRLMLAGGLFAACGSDNTQCNPNDNSTCDNGQVCEVYTDGSGMHNACVAPTLLKGRVTNAQTGAAVAGARVIAIDGDTHAATSGVAITDALGNYSIRVVAPRMSGATKDFTLRVSAAGYEEFPSGIRIALPISVMFGADPKGAAVVTGPQDVALSPIANAPAGAIAGTVSGDKHAGVLVVAEAGGKGYSTVTDGGGNYVIFNVPDGTYTVSGYFIGVSFAPAANVVVAGARKDGVNLAETGAATGKLTGALDYVAGAPNNPTSVVLQLPSTKEVPPGFSAPAMNGPYTLDGVPDGTYNVLASYPNDGLVKDPDTTLGNTGTPTVTFTGGNTVDAGQFKVTAPVDMIGPDANAIVMGTPTFTWMAYSSSGLYRLDVYDAQGNQIWEMDTSATSLAYAGPALISGEFYKWHLIAFHSTDTTRQISMTEDLRGVWQQK